MSTRRGSVPQLRRRRLGVIHLVFFTVSASAPLAVLAGGDTTTFAITGNTAVPLSFVVLALVLALFAVGYAAMSRHVANAGAFYSYLARGINRPAAVAGAFVALISYNGIQIALYGLFGFGMSGFLKDGFGIEITWWIGALIAFVLVGVLGLLRVDLNAAVLAVLLILECLVTALYDVGAFMHPAGPGVFAAGFDPLPLLGPTGPAVFSFGIAAFIGFESSAIYSEECKDPRRTVARATYATLAFTGIFYSLSAWAMEVNVGPDNLQQQATENGPGLVFAALAEHWGPSAAFLASMLLLTSTFAGLLSFHNAVARYLFALGRERVLPEVLDTVGARSGGPVAGSLLQSLTALVVLLIFIATGADPMLQVFTWPGAVATLGVVLLMAGTAVSVVGFFRSNPRDTTLWQRTIAPASAAVLLGILVILLVVKFDVMIGDSASPLRYILPALVLGAAVAGYIWGLVLKSRRPDVYAGIGNVALAPEADVLQLDLPALPTGQHRQR